MIFRRMFVFSMALCLTATAFAQTDGARGTASATIKGKKISINYGRPHLGGHGVSELPSGAVWRLGMNEATRIETTGNLGIAGKTVKAGTYTLWVKRTGENSWVLAFHPKTGVWGDPPLTEGYVAELPLTMGKAPKSADLLTINLTDSKGKARIRIHWGTSELTGSFDVS